MNKEDPGSSGKTGPTLYRDAGVDIDAASAAKKRIATLAAETFGPAVLSDVGHFGALYRLGAESYRDPVLVSSVDGVGTKLRVAFLTGRHDTVGYDLVSHCVNDVLAAGGLPLFFLDYIALGKMDPNQVEEVVKGITLACREAGCALIGGETAEMPGFYQAGEYDLVGFVVGIAERDAVLDGSRVKEGDTLLALASNGLHTNGYSLARKLFTERKGLKPDDQVPELGCTVGEELLKTHRMYLPALRDPLARGEIHALAHITGGGITDNVPRVLPKGLSAEIRKGTWDVLPVFRWLAEAGEVPEDEMYRTFNMGVGMIVSVAADRADAIREEIGKKGEDCRVVGRVIQGKGEVAYV